jgi:hypothetical protein
MFISGILKKPTTEKMKSMKTTVRILAITASLLSSLAVSRAQFTAGDLVVVRVGDGTTTLVNSAGPISLLEINAGGTLIGSPISVPSGTSGLQISGTATSEGQLVLNANHSALTLAGYVPPFGGSGSLSGRSAANAPRGYVTIDYNRNVSATTTLPGTTTYSGDNVRSAFASGTSLWFSGSKNGTPSGVVYYNGTSASSVSNVNTRVLNDFNNNLYYSTGSGTVGIYKYSGLPTTSTVSTPVITGVTSQGSNPYDFALSPDGNTMYVADSDLGVQKFTFNGSSWTLSYNFTDTDASGSKAFGLAVDFSGSNPVIYWSSPNDIWSATDLGSPAAGASILLAGANYAFRGLDFSPQPVPEPSTLALAGMGLAALWGFARRNRKS